jgi:ATP-binding cassette subfamily C (CFTR/MRP) protein 1
MLPRVAKRQSRFDVDLIHHTFFRVRRQLIVIARAMLTGASIVIMDEATASVDADTDARIQRVFRAEFKDATCITVAHRLNTIMDSDLVLVMDNGKVNEC